MATDLSSPGSESGEQMSVFSLGGLESRLQAVRDGDIGEMRTIRRYIGDLARAGDKDVLAKLLGAAIELQSERANL